MSAAAQLLEKTTRINREYDALKRSRRHDFNIFSLLRQEDDEIYLHSRFICELLNPDGMHQMGTRLLELFLSQIGVDGFDVSEVTVQREYHNIDIFIANANCALIIENKIYAPDQPKQLQRYYKEIRKEGFTQINIVYLTLFGDEPGTESIGNLDQTIVTPVSYSVDIRDWLEQCLEAAQPYPVIAQTLIQYQHLVEKLTGQAQGRHLMEVKELLFDQENLAAAMTISQALQAFKIDLQHKFWVTLEEKLSAAGYDITEYWKYSRRSVEAYYNKGVRRYGILFSLPELANQEILAFFVGVSHRVYYGLIPLEGGSPVSMMNDPGFTLLSEILKSLDDTWSGSPTMVGWRPTRRRFDFYAFNTPDILALTDSDCLNTYLDELVDEITESIEVFYAACEDDPRLYENMDW
jgi:hypothetical protein